MENRTKTAKPIIPAYAVFPLLLCVAVNFLVYMGSSAVTEGWKHYNLELAMDRAVPVMPIFVSVYLGCYVFWIFNYILIVRQGKEQCYRFITADIISRIVCGLFFLFLPTTIVRPSIAGSGIWEQLLLFVYQIDSPTRLFPSIHCLVSWMSYIGIRGNKEIPKIYRAFSCIFALLVCVSTQMTKQHYIVDVFGGILLAEGAYRLVSSRMIYQYPGRLFDWLYRRCFLERMTSVAKEVDCDE